MEQSKADDLGRLIGEALKTRRGDSQRAAAGRAGVHESWWRQVVNGGFKKGEMWVPVKASPETYVAMGAAVGVESQVRELLGDEAPDETVGGADEDDVWRYQRPQGITDQQWEQAKRTAQATLAALFDEYGDGSAGSRPGRGRR